MWYALCLAGGAVIGFAVGFIAGVGTEMENRRRDLTATRDELAATRDALRQVR